MSEHSALGNLRESALPSMMQGPEFWSKNLTGYPAHRNTIKGGGMPADCTPSRRAQIDHDGRWTFKRGRKRQTLSEEDHKRQGRKSRGPIARGNANPARVRSWVEHVFCRPEMPARARHSHGRHGPRASEDWLLT
jgi:hypothetical protein